MARLRLALTSDRRFNLQKIRLRALLDAVVFELRGKGLRVRKRRRTNADEDDRK